MIAWDFSVVGPAFVPSDEYIYIGWCQGYIGLQEHYEAAYKEIELPPPDSRPDPPYAIFAKSYLAEIAALPRKKLYDYIFIGSIQSNPVGRAWVIEFAKRFFTASSVFINTDAGPWEPLGDFDKTLSENRYTQKNSMTSGYRSVEENRWYFETMSAAKFILCPAGDAAWSFRFYETLMCGAIPIVESWHHTYRTLEESKIRYFYFLNTAEHEYDDDHVDYNETLLHKYHTLSLASTPP
jgi:Exostosin family